VDVHAAAGRGVIVTNTPDVLTEEVADTVLGLLLMTVRELSAAERHLRAGKWAADGAYPLTSSLRDRTVGLVGLGRIGLTIAKRLDVMKVPVVYHARRQRDDVPYRHYADLCAMAADVDTLIVIVPGGASTRHLVDAAVLKALGPNGVLISAGRGTSVDEAALIDALRNRTIHAAGLDVFADEPNVPAALMALPNAVLLPHVGSASVHTRRAMGQLVVANLTSWFDDGRPAHAGGRDSVGRKLRRHCFQTSSVRRRTSDSWRLTCQRGPNARRYLMRQGRRRSSVDHRGLPRPHLVRRRER